MAYRVGKRKLRRPGTEDEWMMPGEQIPQRMIVGFANVRRMLETGEIACDFKDGEPRIEQMPYTMKATVVTEPMARDALKERGIEVEDAADQKFVFGLYDVVFLGLNAKDVARAKGISEEALVRLSTGTPAKVSRAKGRGKKKGSAVDEYDKPIDERETRKERTRAAAIAAMPEDDAGGDDDGDMDDEDEAA